MTRCLFCRIASGKTAAHIVHEDEAVVAFLFTGGDVAHAHAHVVPMHEKTGITSRRCFAERELAGVAPRLRLRLGDG